MSFNALTQNTVKKLFYYSSIGKDLIRIHGGTGSKINRNYLGRFFDFFEACCVRKSAEIKLNYHKNHGELS